MLRFSSLFVLVVTLGLSPGARAFSTEDHGALMRAAIDRSLDAGGPRALEVYRTSVLHGATAEDLNLHVKWTGWHHYYRPDGPLPSLVREGADARVRLLWEEALEAAREGNLPRAWDRVGHLAHHIQDVGSPPHVVPVSHAASDGFEDWGLRYALSRLPPRELAPMSGAEAQHAHASETLEAVRTQSLTTDDGVSIPWSAFWAEPAPGHPGAFGDYGAVGNAFGRAAVDWRGQRHPVSGEVYDAFMADRAAAAVAYTRAFLEWAAGQFEAVAAPGSVAPPARPYRPAPELSVQGIGGLSRDSVGSSYMVGVRASMPLPHALGLSLDWMKDASGGLAPRPESSTSLSLLSPPLWTWRPGPKLALDMRAVAGVGLYSWSSGSRLGVPAGLRVHALLNAPLIASLDVRYLGLNPPTGPWRHGVAWTLGLGMAWGDS
ncbi:hypothetical protein LZ198_01330 [Myxococcus sp. K15C18031901]|uniref:hypothetical protein n=1 Tax=Myxococcus dinghuensis TaxID=2906761 RepID=UPI0020A7A6FA|nr:hypothetical protein [Myxococcus dinghuensis]MCP3097510.1 hypothetical protein [Myxococcus dinghuensis]